MLAKRVTASFRAVYLYDPSVLQCLVDQEHTEYAQTRDFSAIEEKLKKAETPPTIFHCKPLLVKFEHLADQATTSVLQSDAAWSIFRNHVERIENFDDITMDEDGNVREENRKDIPRDVVDDIAYVIVNKANLKTRGFSLPRTFSGDRIQARLEIHRAQDAKERSA